jgi:Zn-dependent protease
VLPTSRGSLRLFRFAGIQVYLHWSWFLVVLYTVQARRGGYDPVIWTACLFIIVLMHEFGHSLACRSVGGHADEIFLWPFGGVAYVKPPQRPGATLWSIAAGPLVNVLLWPILTVVLAVGDNFNWSDKAPTVYEIIRTAWQINIGLLIFNMLPVYPLDGGQIFQSILWFFIGRAASILVASILGFLGTICLFLLIAFFETGSERIWGFMITGFIGLMCWRGFAYSRMLSKIRKLPHRAGYKCPSCNQPPLIGSFWTCSNCRNRFDTFETHASCPFCQALYDNTMCLACGESSPFSSWTVHGALPPIVN